MKTSSKTTADVLCMAAMHVEQKVDFFVHCQRLLLKYHPDSVYILTKENWLERKHFALDFIKKYKGYCYEDDKAAILYNKIRVDDTADVISAVKQHLYQSPRDLDYNALCIDFAAFGDIKDCKNFVKIAYSAQCLYVVFARHNEIKLYNVDTLLNRGLRA